MEEMEGGKLDLMSNICEQNMDTEPIMIFAFTCSFGVYYTDIDNNPFFFLRCLYFPFRRQQFSKLHESGFDEFLTVLVVRLLNCPPASFALQKKKTPLDGSGPKT